MMCSFRQRLSGLLALMRGADADGDATQTEAVLDRGAEVRRVRSGLDWAEHAGRGCDGAIAALTASKPGKATVNRQEQSELVEVRSEIARLERTIIEQAVERRFVRSGGAEPCAKP